MVSFLFLSVFDYSRYFPFWNKDSKKYFCLKQLTKNLAAISEHWTLTGILISPWGKFSWTAVSILWDFFFSKSSFREASFSWTNIHQSWKLTWVKDPRSFWKPKFVTILQHLVTCRGLTRVFISEIQLWEGPRTLLKRAIYLQSLSEKKPIGR